MPGVGVPGQDDFRLWNLGGSYKLGAARLMAVVHQAAFKPAGQAERTMKLWALSATVPVGQGEIRAAYQSSDVAGGPAAPTPAGLRDKDDARQLSIGYIHHLSKRTALYADWGRISNRGLSALTIPGGVTTDANLGVLPDRNSTALGLGLRHAF